MQDNAPPKRPRGRPTGSTDQAKRKTPVRKQVPANHARNWLHKRVGHLVIIARGPVNHGRKSSQPALWYAQCDCGNVKLTDARSLKKGEVKTCGVSGCPFKAALHTANFKKGADDKVLHQAIDKVGYVGFSLTADEVRKLLKTSCKVCGHRGPGHEIRCFEHSKGYVLPNCYSICNYCAGLVPISVKLHMTWEAVLQKIKGIVEHLGLTGDLEPGVDKIFLDTIEQREKAKQEQSINVNTLCI